MTRLLFAVFTIVQTLFSASALGHELRPAFLDVREITGDLYEVKWKVPALGDRRLGLYVAFPATCVVQGEKAGTFQDAAFFERWRARCPGGIKGKIVSISGLRNTLTDVLARVEYLGGSKQTVRLSPESPQFVASGTQTSLEVAGTYLRLGVEHILSGIDHLLFVMALLLLIRNPWMLVKTITAFTVAHSLTLAGSALGYMSLQQKPVEASIALSIAFVASELVKAQAGAQRSSEAYPWLVAFAFGLLHGFGFAGALKEIGLPQKDIPLALLSFNLGVEAGQLLFVAAVLIAFRAAKAVVAVPERSARMAAAYAIGILSTFWLITRLESLWA
ncbi:MAG: HupE/UreJ family protein [Hyphomicrobium sp.]